MLYPHGILGARDCSLTTGAMEYWSAAISDWGMGTKKPYMHRRERKENHSKGNKRILGRAIALLIEVKGGGLAKHFAEGF